MSEAESLDLSAEDLMPSWASGLEHASSPPSPASKTDRNEQRDEQRKGKGQGNRDGHKFDRGGGGGGYRNDDRRQQGGRGKNDRRDHNRGSHDRRREDRQPVRAEDIVPQVDFVVEPTTEAVKALAKHIRSTNRAYAMAEVAKMVLAAPDRYRVIFRTKSATPEGRAKNQTPQDKATKPFRMVRCKTDGSVWLSREEAVSHFLNTPELLKQFYEVEEVKTEAPKGNFSVIAVCGMSGTILGPPNHHEYQQNISALHRERFGNMPLEKFKSRIEMRRDEETLEQWKEQMSTSKHYQLRKDKPESVNKETGPEETTPGESSEEAPTNVESQPSSPPATEETTTEETNEQAAIDSATETPEAENPSDGENEEADAVTTEALESTEGGNPADEESSENESPDETDAAKPEPAITSMAELIQHFREHFARRIFKEVGEARLAGSVSGKELSPALSERMNAEINWQKRGFPLPMVRSLCRKFEQQGLKFFKRGEKALFVTASQPRALSQDTVLTDRLVLMLNHVKDHPGTLAGKLIEHLRGDTPSEAKSPAPEADAQAEGNAQKVAGALANPSKDELALLADLRWLLAEGYLIEFPNSELFAGSVATVNKRKRRPAKRQKKKKPAAKKEAAASATVSKEKPPAPETREAAASAPSEDHKATQDSES